MMKNVGEFFKKYRYILLIIVFGAALMLFPSRSADEKPEDAPSSETEFSLADEEKRIAQALSNMAGAGRTEVVLTLYSTTETVYQTDLSEDEERSGDSLRTNREAETVILSAGSGIQEAAVARRVYPVYKGALIVCEGAGAADVRLNIINAVSALTGLPSNRITVVKSE